MHLELPRRERVATVAATDQLDRREDLLRLLRLADPRSADPEEPDVALLIQTRPDAHATRSTLEIPPAFDSIVPAGLPNPLSSDHVEWELIDLAAHAAAASGAMR